MPRPPAARGGDGPEPRPEGAPRRLDRLARAWAGRSGPLYERFVVLGNEGARDNGFADLGALWRSAYDMTPEDFERETDRLWAQVKPLYDDLHCYVRAGLQKTYGKALVPDGKPIPRTSPREHVGPGVDQRLPAGGAVPRRVQPRRHPDAQGAEAGTPRRMVKLGETFFTGLGLGSAAGDLLDPLAVHQAARPRGGVPRLGLGRDLLRRPAHQDVHPAQGGGPDHHPPRAGAQLLPARLREAALPLHGRGERRLPRGGGRRASPSR